MRALRSDIEVSHARPAWQKEIISKGSHIQRWWMPKRHTHCSSTSCSWAHHTSLTICLSVVPSDDETYKTLTIVKVVSMTFPLLAGGVVIYVLGNCRQAPRLNAHMTVADPA